jgi:4-amino-4-deoxy-L-arabinose transferase-like glycosyltransferase
MRMPWMADWTTKAVVRHVVWFGLILYFVLFVLNATTRTGRFSPDSMNYVNVARNITAGHGITQPTLGFNQPRISPNDAVPSPLIAHPPLYPLMISVISRTGVSAPVSALALSAVAMGLILILVYGLAASLYDKEVGLMSVSLVLFYAPLRYMAGYAWSDPVGIALMLSSLWLLARKRTRNISFLVIVAGLVAGLAFATRYALFPLSGIGILFLFVSSARERRINNACLYGFGFAVPAGLLWGHNFLVKGSIMPPSDRAPADFLETVSAAFHSICGKYVNGLPSELQLGLLALSLVVSAIPLVKGGIGHRSRELFLSNDRYILFLWSLVYLIFIVAQRSAWYFGDNRANEMLRIAAPAGVILLICWTGLAVKALKMPHPFIMTSVLLLVLLSIWREAQAAIGTTRLDFQRPILYSQRLAWIATHTSKDDLIIGEDTVDIPFFLQNRPTVSFSPYPITQYATYDLIMSYSLRHCAAYRNIYVVLRSRGMSEKEWRSSYGDFFADLVFGHVEKYPAILLLTQLQDASVFIIRCR